MIIISNDYGHRQLELIREKIMHGVLLRSKARWVVDGERPASTFAI